MDRKIYIANTKTQKRYEIMTDATTLGELKAALDANGIDYADLSFTEGLTKTELLRDDSLLPKDVEHKGQITNELVILLTNTKKKIESGAMTRPEAYAIIKENGLQDAIKEEFGRNFTQVPTADLINFIAANVDDEDEDFDDEEEYEEDPRAYVQNIANNIYDNIKRVAAMGDLDIEAVESIAERCMELAERMKVNEKLSSKIEVTDEEANSKIDEILADF